MENRLVINSEKKEDSGSKHEKKETILLISTGPSRTLFGGSADKITLSEKLILACLNKDNKSALHFIENGADVNWASRTYRVLIPKPTFLTQWISYSGYHYDVPHDQVATPLLAAVVNGLDDVVHQLIQKGADPNKLYNFSSGLRPGVGPTADETLLHVAVRIPNNVRIIRALLDGGANPEALATYNDRGAIIATSISPAHSVFLLKEVACACVLGCIVFSLCCSVCRGKTTQTPNVTPIQMARLSGFQENIDALGTLAPAPQSMAMK